MCDAKDKEIARLQVWLADENEKVKCLQNLVSDLQSGQYINCVYCGHRYGPRGSVAATIPEATSCSMAQALTDHIAVCPLHPLAAERRRSARLLSVLDAAFHALRSYQYGNSETHLAQTVADSCEQVIKEMGTPEGKLIGPRREERREAGGNGVGAHPTARAGIVPPGGLAD